MTNTTGQERALKEALTEIIRRSELCIHQNTGRWNMSIEHDRRSHDIISSNADIARDALNALPQQAATDEGEGWRPLTDTAWLDGRDVELLAHDMVVSARYCGGGWTHTLEFSEYDGPVWSCFDDKFQFEIEEISKDAAEWHHGPVKAWRMPTVALSTPTSQPPAAETRLREVVYKAAQIAGDTIWGLPMPKHWDRDRQEYIDWCAQRSKSVREMIMALTQPEPTAQQKGDELSRANMHRRLRAVVLNDAGQTLDKALMDGLEGDHDDVYAGTLYQAIDRLAVAALSAQQAAGEAVAWLHERDGCQSYFSVNGNGRAGWKARPLYAAPQPEAWRGIDLLTKAVGDIAAALTMAGQDAKIPEWTAPYCEAINAADAVSAPLTDGGKAQPTETQRIVAAETIESMIAWGDETFGPREPERAVSRAHEEWLEMAEEVPGTMQHAIEAADVIICLLRIPLIREALNQKMAKNRGRTWKLMGDGTGYHVKPASGEHLAGEGDKA